MENNNNEWSEYRNLVIHELKRSNDRLIKIEQDLSEIKQDMAIIKTKLYFGAGLIAVFTSVIISVLSSVIKDA